MKFYRRFAGRKPPISTVTETIDPDPRNQHGLRGTDGNDMARANLAIQIATYKVDPR